MPPVRTPRPSIARAPCDFVGDGAHIAPSMSFRASARREASALGVHTGVGNRLSSPPSEREVSARSADGGREATRSSLPQSAAPTAPSQRGPNSAAPPRCHCEARSAVAIRPPPPHPSSKSQQFHTKFCAPIQNVKISPETVADGIRRCYI